MKFVYVLHSSKEDNYYEQLLVSVTSLLKHHPDANIEVVCDKDTYEGLVGVRSKIKEYAKIIPIDVPDIYSAKSRYLKTNLRNFTDGDFLYIDTDTIIVDNLYDIQNIEGDILAVPTRHGTHNPLFDTMVGSIRKKIGWSEPGETPEYNGGLLFVRDNENTHKFFDAWHLGWFQCVEVGWFRDQLSLQECAKGGLIKTIDHEWNCLVRASFCKSYIKNAKILHYFATVHPMDVYRMLDLQYITKTGEVSEKCMQFIENPKPYFERKFNTFHLLCTK